MKKFYFSKKVGTGAVLILSAISFLFYAYSTGITGRTLKNGTGCNCHAESPSSEVTVQISGPDTLIYNQTAVYSVTLSGGPLVRGGTNIAASAGILSILGADLQVIGDELTHTAPKEPSTGTVTFSFNYTAPSTSGNQTLFANGNSVNFNGENTGDQWNFAANKSITVIPVIPVEISSFTAEVNRADVHLNWSTASEKNNNGFEVLRRNDNQEWKVVGFIKGKGNSIEVSGYSYSDKNLQPGMYSYQLKQIDFNGFSTYYNLISEVEVNPPSEFVLYQNYPNPFNPSTLIEFDINSAQTVKLKVYNLLGQEIAVLLDDYLPAGSYKKIFNTRELKNISTGIYLYELTAGTKKSVRKMILNK